MKWALSITAFLVSVAIVPLFNRVDMESRWVILSVMVPLMFAKAQTRWTAAHGLLLVIVAYSALSLLWTPILYDGLYWQWHLMLGAAVFCIAWEASDMRSLSLALGIGMTVNVAAMIVAASGWYEFPEVNSPSGLFVNRNFLAEAAVPVVVLLVAQRRWLLMIPSLACAIAPLARGPLGALAIVGIVALWRKSALAAITAVFLCGVAAFLYTENIHRDLVSSVKERVDIWRDAIDGMTVRGNGIGSFYIRFPTSASRIDTISNRPDHAHNETVEFIYELGVAGAVLIGALAFLAFGWSGESLALASILLCGGVGFPLHEPFTLFLAAALAGCICRHRYSVRGVSDVRASHRDKGVYGGDDHRRISRFYQAGSRDIPTQPSYAPRSGSSSGKAIRDRALGNDLAANRLRTSLRSLVARFAPPAFHPRGANHGATISRSI